MGGLDLEQDELFSYTTLEQRIPADHPLRPLRELVDSVLASMDQDFDGLKKRQTGQVGGVEAEFFNGLLNGSFLSFSLSVAMP